MLISPPKVLVRYPKVKAVKRIPTAKMRLDVVKAKARANSSFLHRVSVGNTASGAVHRIAARAVWPSVSACISSAVADPAVSTYEYKYRLYRKHVPIESPVNLVNPLEFLIICSAKVVFRHNR